jgi:lipopolysaccharide export system permease protein
MRILDRYVLRHFVLAYAVCFVSFLSLYVVIDLFSRIDEFTQAPGGPGKLLTNVGVYYLFRVPWFFQRLSPVIALLAAMFALAWLERNNEVVGWLAAGVPVRRLTYPILAACVGLAGVSVLNRELLIPPCSPYLQRTAEDPRGLKNVLVQPVYDSEGVHIEGKCAVVERRMIQNAAVTLPASLTGRLIHLRCSEMFYLPDSPDEGHGWVLRATAPAVIDGRHPSLTYMGPGTYFLHSDATFQRLTRRSDFFYYEPTSRLVELARGETQVQRRAEIVALLHRRLTAPVLDFILVLLGLPLIVGRPDRNVYLKIGLCLLLYAVFQGVQVVTANLAQQEVLDPSLGAWLPVLVFGPAAMAWLDALRG